MRIQFYPRVGTGYVRARCLRTRKNLYFYYDIYPCCNMHWPDFGSEKLPVLSCEEVSEVRKGLEEASDMRVLPITGGDGLEQQE